MVHSLACTTGPMRVAMGGGVPAGPPQLLPRIHARPEKSLADYLQIPGDGAYVITPALGTIAAPLRAIALAMPAAAVAAFERRVATRWTRRSLCRPPVSTNPH